MQLLHDVPYLAIIVLVIRCFGFDEEAKIFLVAIGVVFPLYLNTYHGIPTVDGRLIDMARVYGLSPMALFCRIVGRAPCPRSCWACALPGHHVADLDRRGHDLGYSGIGYMTTNARVPADRTSSSWSMRCWASWLTA